MENKNTDRATRDILAHWRPELRHPDFNALVMPAIAQERFRKMQRQLFLTWIFVAFTAELVIGLLLWSSGVTLADVASFPNLIVIGFGQALHGLLEYHYVIVPLAVMLLLKRVIDSRVRYS